MVVKSILLYPAYNVSVLIRIFINSETHSLIVQNYNVFSVSTLQ